jgi:hypothetical protein
VLDGATAEGARAQLHRILDRPEAVQQLERLGVEPAEAHRRVDALSDAELRSLGESLADDPAGGGAVGAIVGAALIVFLVLLVTDILGLTDVFPFVRKPARR